MDDRGEIRILIADDDPNVHQMLSPYCKREGYMMVNAYDGLQTLRQVRDAKPDIIVLDIVMPGMDGLEVCREIRKSSNVPIIMLSARDEEFDRLLGLEMGADDYVTKPFSPREVVARAKTVLRRVREPRSAEEGAIASIVIDNLEIDLGSYTVRLDGEVIPCTPREVDILWALANSPGIVFSRENLLKNIWGYDFPGGTRAVDSSIKRIRAKLCKDGNQWNIATVWGVGYRFERFGDK